MTNGVFGVQRKGPGPRPSEKGGVGWTVAASPNEWALRELRRRSFIRALLAAAGAATWGRVGSELRRPMAAQATAQAETPDDGVLDAFAANIFPGGPPKDGIPAIDHPVYESVEAADRWLSPTSVVFGWLEEDVPKALPQPILVWHEIVNDRFDQQSVSFTYCPLTGSAVGLFGQARDGRPLTFGTSGNLVNSNLLMYDRQTDSLWPQILGMAIQGPERGRALSHVPLVWTTWERWKGLYPTSLVLSRQTGYIRPYGSDPYGSYGRHDTYYQVGEPFFPVMRRDARLAAKTPVVGVKDEGGGPGSPALAFPKAAVARLGAVHGLVGRRPVVALWSRELEAAWVFERVVGGRMLVFRPVGAGLYRDEQTSTVWKVTPQPAVPAGSAIDGPLKGERLRWVPSYDVMWFAWYAFYPHTAVATT